MIGEVRRSRRPDLAWDPMARFRTPALAWAAVALVLVAVQWVSNATFVGHPVLMWPGLRDLFEGWMQFDANEFLSISEDGYWYREGARSPTSFFPLFPMLIWLVRPLAGSTPVAGVVVSMVGGLASVLAFWAWTDRWKLDPKVRMLALWVALVYPWSWFLYGVPFADGVFVALVIGAFLLVEREQYVLAGLVGAMATAARPTGLFLAPALVVLALERAGAIGPRPLRPGWWSSLEVPTLVHRARFRWVMVAPLLALLGVGAYSAYLGIRFGRPFVFITDQSLYNGSGIKTWLKAGLVDGWLNPTDPWRTFAQTTEALIALGVLLAVPCVGRRFGWGYGVFVLALVAMPSIATRDFNSTGRYLLAAFPVAVVVAEALAKRPPGCAGGTSWSPPRCCWHSTRHSPAVRWSADDLMRVGRGTARRERRAVRPCALGAIRTPAHASGGRCSIP